VTLLKLQGPEQQLLLMTQQQSHNCNAATATCNYKAVMDSLDEVSDGNGQTGVLESNASEYRSVMTPVGILNTLVTACIAMKHQTDMS